MFDLLWGLLFDLIEAIIGYDKGFCVVLIAFLIMLFGHLIIVFMIFDAVGLSTNSPIPIYIAFGVMLIEVLVG